LPGNKLIDLFSSHFFYLSDRKNAETRKMYLCKLNKIVFNASDDLKATFIVLDTSIKNNVATSIAHIHIYNSPIIKTIYYAINIISIKAELFTIRCSLNQASCLANIKCIVIITNFIHIVKKIFNLSIYSYQIRTLAISKEIREFFKRKSHNSLEFWDCPSQDKWLLHNIVNKETKKFNLSPIFSCKSL